jgi:lysosomal Pro-X carboxypeptidase
VTLLADGLKWINDAFKFCTPLKSKADVTKLKGYLNNLWTDLVMMDYPYPTSFLMPLPGHPVQVCFVL